MNREILFRGQSVGDLAPWIYGYYHFDKSLNAHYICDRDSLYRYEVRGETIGQYAEWKDINGIEIFEGDVVHVYYGVGKVIFSAGCFMIEWIDDKEANMELLSMQHYKTGHIREDLVVTGNIFSNPELLQVK